MMPFDATISLIMKSTDPIEVILSKSYAWINLQFVYVEMVKNKDLVRLSDLPKERKLHYWNMVDKSWEQWKKITVVQALYVWDEIKKEL